MAVKAEIPSINIKIPKISPNISNTPHTPITPITPNQHTPITQHISLRNEDSFHSDSTSNENHEYTESNNLMHVSRDKSHTMMSSTMLPDPFQHNIPHFNINYGEQPMHHQGHIVHHHGHQQNLNMNMNMSPMMNMGNLQRPQSESINNYAMNLSTSPSRGHYSNYGNIHSSNIPEYGSSVPSAYNLSILSPSVSAQRAHRTSIIIADLDKLSRARTVEDIEEEEEVIF